MAQLTQVRPMLSGRYAYCVPAGLCFHRLPLDLHVRL
jgi:hypothetical protein